MQSLTGSSAHKGVAAVFGFIATTAAALIGAVFAVIFASVVVVLGLLASVVIGLSAMALGARRAARREAGQADDGVIEARRVGGHSWVAYGWDGQRRA